MLYYRVTKYKVEYKVDADAEWMVKMDANQEEMVCFLTSGFYVFVYL